LTLPAGYDHRRIWLCLCLGWAVSAADRAITGPVVTWMIRNKVAFLGGDTPFATGGLIGGIFFAAYMLAQFPGGYAGDRFGHRSVIVISLFWAALATLLSGLCGGLAAFIAARIFTGLGEGVYYANDRAIIAATTPKRSLSLALGVVITGLAIGITLATAGAPLLIDLGRRALGAAQAWRMPFFLLAAVTALASLAIAAELRKTRDHSDRPARALALTGRYALPFFLLLFGLFLASRHFGLPAWSLTLLELGSALAVIAFIFTAKDREMQGALSDRNLVLLYLSWIAILWNLWFFGFWAVAIVGGDGSNSFSTAALTAMFTGLAGLVGFPAGGWLADRASAARRGRKKLLMALTVAQGALTLVLALYIARGGHAPPILGALLFSASLVFSALQPVSHALLADLARPEHRGSAFGLGNLIGEIGAVLSPAISGALRDASDGWAAAIFLDVAVIAAGFLCLLFVRERVDAGGPAHS
jgi:ACS family D-galactonate transporter-like MFS transporter